MILLYEKGETLLCSKNNRSTKQVKIQKEVSSLTVTSCDETKLFRDEEMVEVNDMETNNPEREDNVEVERDGDRDHGTLGGERVSFKDKLINIKHPEKKIEEFETKEEDVLLKTEDGVPMISFSNRVHNYISRSIKNCAIIHLLGRSISYRALVGRLQNL